MSKSADELWRTLEESSRMPFGAARIAVTEQVIRHADAAGDPDLSFSARMYATNAYTHGGDQAKSFVSFSWCLSDFDKNPSPYHERWRHNLLWHFKFMVTALLKFPEVPLARTYAVLDDMERRYREGGHSLQAVHKHRMHVARHIGDEDAADRYYEQWITAPRDDLSDCIGCDPSTRVSYLSERRRDEEAIALAEPVLGGRLTCLEQPQSILRGLMLPYLRTGHPDRAADAHRRGYRLVRGNRADLWDIGDHIEFCSRTGNEQRAVEILQRHIDWLAEPPSPAAGMMFAAKAAQALRRLTALGHGDTEVARRAGDLTVAALADELTAYATELASRFDARNGTSKQGRQVNDAIGGEPYTDSLPLSATARRGAPIPEPAPQPEPEVPPTADASTLLDLADRYEDEDNDSGVTVVLAALDERFPELTDPLVVAHRAMLRGGEHWRVRDLPGALAAWEQGVEVYRQAGTEAEISVATARLGAAYVLSGRPDEGVPAIEADVTYQQAHGTARGRARAHGRKAVMLAVQEQHGPALDELALATAAAQEAGDERLRARFTVQRAQNLASLHRHEEAEAAAAEAQAFYREHGPRDRLAAASHLRAALTEDPERRAEALTDVLANGVAEMRLEARFNRGAAYQQLERVPEAIEDFVEAVALSAEADEERAGAYARHNLARAYHSAGRTGEAAEVGEEAVLWLDRIGDPDTANDSRLLLANVYRQMGADEDALSRYEELIERLADNPAGRGQIREYCGDLLYKLDRDAAAAERFAAAAEDLRNAEDPVGEVRLLRRQALALRWAGEPDRALEVSRETFGKQAGLGDEPVVVWERATLAYETAQLHAARGETEDALRVLGDAPERLSGLGNEEQAEEAEGFREHLTALLNER